MSENVIELKNVKKTFTEYRQELAVLRNINFSMSAGQNVCVCGDSGSGKTTLVNIIGLLERPSGGSVLWQSRDVTMLSQSEVGKSRAKMFGYIFQHYNLIPELNVIENVLFPLRINGNVAHEDIMFAHELLEHVQMSSMHNRFVDHLSGGEKQRVAAVRAMINHPRVIIADEPTGSLDENTGMCVMDAILNMCKYNNSTLLLITHNSKFAERMDIVYQLRNGELHKN